MASGENERKAVKSAILCQKSPLLVVSDVTHAQRFLMQASAVIFQFAAPSFWRRLRILGKSIWIGLEENKHDAAAQPQKHRCERQQRVCCAFARRVTLHFKVQMARFGTFCRVLRMRTLFLAHDASSPHKKMPQAASLPQLGRLLSPLRRRPLSPPARAGELDFFFQAAGVDPKSFKSASQLTMFFFNF